MKRKIIKITATDYRIYALADDGTLWIFELARWLSGKWSQVPALPDAPDPPNPPIPELKA